MKRMKLMILTALAVLLSCSSKAGELRYGFFGYKSYCSLCDFLE